MDAHDRRGRADRGRPQARGRARGRARRERGGRGGDGRGLCGHPGAHGGGASLGIATAEAARVAETARARLRFPGEAYVLALAGGTGVGKSTVLNALAGEEVSPAGARRPTTAEPVAWVPADKRAELAQLLEWLGVTQVREHHADGLGELAVLDLPDFDSVAVEHRARVDALLPKVDAVAWVLDTEQST